MFTVLTVLSLALLMTVLSYRRLMEKTEGIDQSSFKERLSRYFSSLLSQSKAIFRPEGFWGLKALYLDWIDRNAAGWTKWFFVGLSVSSAYLVLSGFIYALFFVRAISGLPLLLHVVAGGIFAICLPAAVLLGAHRHTLGSILPREAGARPQPKLRPEEPSLEARIFFWLIAAAGFSLILTALSAMIPFFSLSCQRELIGLHRYSALVGLLSSFAYFHFSGRAK